MKNILKVIFLSVLFSSMMISCVNDEETDIPYVDKPLFKENFNDNFPAWIRYSELGAQVWSLEPTYGNPYNGYDPNPCAKMTGYSGSSNANIDWLISPAQDLSTYTNASFAFDNAYKFDGPVIETFVSNNYSGTGNPNATGVTWVKIDGLKLSEGNYKYKFSGILDISGFTGLGNETVYVAIKYTSTTTASSTWEIDNFKVYGTN